MMKMTILLCTLIIGEQLAGQTERYDIVINEILADPSPVVGLPNCEFIELRNNTKQPINLYKWKIDNGSTSASINTEFILGPDSLVILCSKSKAIFFNNPEKTIGLSPFPSLNNETDVINLCSSDGKTIHAVEYSKKLFNNPVKSEGGWSIEMIDPQKPCNKNNWDYSIHFSGGTPGKENSVFGKTVDDQELKALQCIALDSNSLLLKLNQGADSNSLGKIKNYSLGTSNEHPTKAEVLAPLFKDVFLQFNFSMNNNEVYNLHIHSILYCKSNKEDSFQIRTGLTKPAETGDIVINEILFDPSSDGADFVEMYNNSKSVINTKEIYLTNRKQSGSVGTAYSSSETDYNLFPGEYFVATTDTAYLKKNWIQSDQSKMSEIKTMPSYPDDKGDVMLVNKQGNIIDELHYSDNMHFPFLRDKSGASIERISPTINTNISSNWHSASSSAHYGTPTYINSQYIHVDTTINSINIKPTYFSPDNNGIDDILSIQYNFSKPGTLISIIAFDINGMMICKIADNQLCGSSGSFIWDGLDKNKRRIPSGIYIILAETLDLSGKRKIFKQAVVADDS